MEISSEVPARELNQQTAQILARVEAGETVTVTKNGRPVAILRPYGAVDPPAYGFRTDPMGEDPYFQEPPSIEFDPMDVDEQDELMRQGFGVE
ncbi:type II toxin-antitoxin system Phd/YefM family antitoxin [Kitasatospora sp. P5_F3]